ncbi:MAG: DUF2950 domain-containing protein [Candidatus Binataceae bacterium]|nr:DUF2950 domain-containing protein [Candidatus Binataceae bacterium]
MKAAEMIVVAADRRRRNSPLVMLVRSRRVLPVLFVSLLIGLGGALSAFAQTPGQKTFSSPTEAADALAAAAQNHDEAAMLEILGPSAQDLISSGNQVADQKKQDFFARNYHASHQFAVASDGRMFLYVGPENWPVPVPLRKSGSQWYFDTAYGRREIRFRRIGSDELNVIKVCTAVVDAQRQYHSALHDGATESQYAQKFRSTPGNHDGLFWEAKSGKHSQSPLGPLVAAAAAEGYQPHATERLHPFQGYFYRLLTGQGANAKGGAKGYLVDGKMTGGFAMVAYPARYRKSGVMTFIVNQDGEVYQKDLGPRTDQIVSAMSVYNPDDTWKAVKNVEAAKLQ